MATRRQAREKQPEKEVPSQTANNRTSQTKAEGKQRAMKGGSVNVTFHVTVPEETARSKRTVYITGTFQQGNKKLEDWGAPGQKMKKIDATHWTATIKSPENTQIEYKYTLGDWEMVEVDAQCNDTSNRRVVVHSGDEQTVEDRVQQWKNIGGCSS